MSRFHIENFKDIYNNLDDKELDHDIREILFKISKEINCKITFSKKDNYKSLESLKNFKYTQVKSVIDDDIKYIQNIKVILNKITDKNYINFYINILININYVENNFNDKYLNFCKKILKLLNSNLLYNKTYSLIFQNLINDYPIFKDILNEEINNFDNIFNNLDYVEPEISYDNFCEYNKNNEIRRSNILFFCNLFLIDLISLNNIINFFNFFINKFNHYILNDNKKK